MSLLWSAILYRLYLSSPSKMTDAEDHPSAENTPTASIDLLSLQVAQLQVDIAELESLKSEERAGSPGVRDTPSIEIHARSPPAVASDPVWPAPTPEMSLCQSRDNPAQESSVDEASTARAEDVPNTASSSITPSVEP